MRMYVLPLNMDFAVALKRWYLQNGPQVS